MSTSTMDPPRSPALPGRDVFADVLAAVKDQVGRVVDVPAFAIDDTTLLHRLSDALQVRAAFEELVARFVKEIDDRDLPRSLGASSTRAYLQASHRMSPGQAGGITAQARAMNDRTETTRRAWADGQICGEQAVVIDGAVRMLSASVETDTLEAAQSDLVAYAGELGFQELRQVANHLVEVIDPDAADSVLSARLEAEEARAWQATMFRGRAGPDGIARFSGRLPNAQYAMLSKALQAVPAPRRNPEHQFERPGVGAESADAGVRADGGTNGDAAVRGRSLMCVDGDWCDIDAGAPLTYPQRLGRAFAELIEHLPTTELPQHGVANAAVVVTIDHEKLATGVGEAQLDTGHTMSASQVRRLACNTGLLPLILGGASQVLDLGRTQRLFDRHQRLALAARDKGCIWPGCDRPPAWCEAHHITPWSAGGATTLSNGCLLCSFHHHLAHDSEWSIFMAADGVPEVTPPNRIDPSRRPTRHTRFKARPG